MSSWACSACTYLNSGSSTKCEVCHSLKVEGGASTSGTSASGTSNPKPKWACRSCSYLNDPNHVQCEMCDNPNLAASPISPPNRGKSAARRQSSGFGTPESNHWICDACNNRNSANKISCAHCSKKRDHWNCLRCTFKNELSEKRCKVCDEMSPVKNEIEKSDSNHQNDDALVRQESANVVNLREIDEVLAKETFEKIIAFCSGHNTSFVDDSFPPNQVSVGNLRRDDDVRENVRSAWNLPGLWRRPQHIFTSAGKQFRWAVFRDPKPTDIVQGILGNCWFLVALAVVAERPEILSNIMITKEYCPQGVYQVRLCIDGQWRIVIVDDYFPCNSRGAFAFSEGRNNQLWVPLIEKALAKAYGSYAALIAGTSREGLTLVTGAPCETICIGVADLESNEMEAYDENLVWARLLSARESSFLMGCSCGCKNGRDMPPESEFKKVGLISKHAYSVLDVKDINGLRLIRLRNPWGQHVWQGDWSEKSPLWTTALKKELNPFGQERGVFWMPFQQFCRYFDSVDVCKFHERWNELRLQIPLPQNCLPNQLKATRLIVVESGEADLTLHKQGFRQENQTVTSKMDLIILVYKELQEGQIGELVGSSKRRICAFVNLNVILQPGTYIIVSTAFNHYGLTHDNEVPTCILAVHSAKMIIGETFAIHPNVIGDAMIKLAAAKGNLNMRKAGVVIYTLTNSFGGLIVVAENRTQDMILTIDCNCEGSHNVVSSRLSLVTSDVIPPCSVQVLNLLSQLESSSSYSMQYRTTFRMCPCNKLLSLKDIWATVTNRPKMDPALEIHVPPINYETSGLFKPRFIQS